MQIENITAVVTGGASGLGFATAQHLIERGARVVITDRDGPSGTRATEQLGPAASFVAGDVTDSTSIARVLDTAVSWGPLRAVVHCAGGGAPVRVLSAEGAAVPLEDFRRVVELNLVGTFDVLCQAAERMVANDPLDGDRGVIVLTSSIAAYEGQAAQQAYASSKAGIIGMTLPAARDLSRYAIRVCTIAPGLFDTAMLTGLSEETRNRMGEAVPHPKRLGAAAEFAGLAGHIIENGMLNGESIRLDGAIRLAAVETMWGNQLAQRPGE